jgi:hypothetical protein
MESLNLAEGTVPADQKSRQTTALLPDRRLMPLALLLGVWVLAFLASSGVRNGPSGKGMAGDLAIFLGAARVAENGGNVYSPAAAYKAERSLLGDQHVAVPAGQSFVRVGNPPLTFWLIRPLSHVPFRLAALAWVLSLYALMALAFLATARFLGWKQPWRPTILFLAMPQTMLAAYYGNLDALVFASVAAAVVLARRYPLLAGAALTTAWLKPQCGLPAVLIVLLFLCPRPRMAAAGFGLASMGTLMLTWLACGSDSIVHWLGALGGYSRDLIAQPDIASFTGLYLHTTAGSLRTAIQVSLIAVAASATLTLRSRSSGESSVDWPLVSSLFVLWFLVTPFAHFHDEVILAIPLLGLAGYAGGAARSRVVFCLYALLGSLILFPANRFQVDLQSLALLPVLFVTLRKSPLTTSSRKLPASLTRVA